MNSKWIPITAGIIGIVNGLFYSCYIGLIYIISGFYVVGHVDTWLFAGSMIMLIGILAIAGGVCAIKRKAWFFVLGTFIIPLIGLIIYTSIYKDLTLNLIIWLTQGLLLITAIILLLFSGKQFRGSIN